MDIFSEYGNSVSTDFANGVVFGVDANGSRLVVGGKTGLVSAGKILYTDDGGTTWNTANLPVGITQVSRVFYSASQSRWYAGSSGSSSYL